MKKVLIVDDNEVLAGLLKEMLERQGDFRVMIAENGESGYKTSLCFDPDIILTDIEMPVKNGLDMIRDIRALRPGIKTIYMSSYPDKYKTSLRDEVTKHNVNVLNKPLHFSKIKELFNLSREEGSGYR
jgi:YesN/AraC family two-component response regulator